MPERNKSSKVKGFKADICNNCGNVKRDWTEMSCKVCGTIDWREGVFDER